MKQMKKKKIRIATHNKPVKSYVIIRVNKNNPNMAILNYSGLKVLVCFRLKPGMFFPPLIKIDNKTIVNEYGDDHFQYGNWHCMPVNIYPGGSYDIYKIYRGMRQMGKTFAKVGILEEFK